MDDYFTHDALFADNLRQHFRIRKNVFDCLYHGVWSFDDYFILKKNVVGRIGFSGYEKCTATLRMLAYGTTDDSWDGYLRMSESTCEDVMTLRGSRQSQKQESGQVCSNLLTACIGNERTAQKLYKDNIRVILRSPSFLKQLHHMIKAPPCYYTVNGNEYNTGYYLVDDIYPPWATFVNTISSPVGQKKYHFAQRQEAARKDVERTFGVLEKRFAVVHGPAKYWDPKALWKVMTYCVVMHNMIVEDEGEDVAADLEFENMGDPIELTDQNPAKFEECVQMHQQIRHRGTHEQLKKDLIKHL
ncbi:uncharacterized protein [Aegilops tauschii subsp. strangulata]|uniref:uncharacterized protein n=1 Tax=Aegilops tauschii subsp. strangulata TaxID=200361 RepID=UPI00098AD61C|nr:uncharacterized protein LOC109743085 [Aegilops tauschii subsp. strangulata]